MYNDDEDTRRVYLVNAALSPDEYRIYPKWFAELMPSGHLTLTLDDVLVFADRFGINEQDKWKIFDVFENPLSTLEKGEFYAFMRLIGHVINGQSPSRDLVFQQAPIPKIIHSSQPTTDSITSPHGTPHAGFSASSPISASPSTEGSRANPFRRFEKERTPSIHRSSFESLTSHDSGRKSSESMIRSNSSEPNSTDVQAVDAFAQLMLSGHTDVSPLNSVVPAAIELPQSGIEKRVKFQTPAEEIAEPTFGMSDESPSTDDDDEEFFDSSRYRAAEDFVKTKAVPTVTVADPDLALPKLHTIHSQHYLVMPNVAEPEPELAVEAAVLSSQLIDPVEPIAPIVSVAPIEPALPVGPLSSESSKPVEGFKSSEPEHRRAPPPPPPRKSHQQATSNEPLTNNRSPIRSAPPAPAMSRTESARKTSIQSESLSSTPQPVVHPASIEPSKPHTNTTVPVPSVAPAPASIDDIDFDAAFDQPLYDAITSPKLSDVKVASTPSPPVPLNPVSTSPVPRVLSVSPSAAPVAPVPVPSVSVSAVTPTSKSSVPPPPPPSRRKVAHTREVNVSTTSSRHHPPPPPPPASHLAHEATSSVTTPQSTAPSSDSQVSDLLADLSALQKEVDALRAQQLDSP
ncbi:hypothetical protein V1512DRAFT_260035 [Lipomyces arxii]|uniref:uncharacterized protein n=1 Tax=Lipomyces arxii TaxID=56418 RepID=UPI0034CD834D